MLSFREITQELFYEKTRMVLTIFAIAWGTFSIAVMLSIGEGLRVNFAKTMANAGNKLLTITPGVTSKNYQGRQANEQLKLNKNDMDAIVTLPNVANVTPQYQFHPKLRYRDQFYKKFLAVTPEYAVIHQIQVGSKGRFISSFDMERRNFVVVIGAITAEKIFAPGENPIGNTIYIDDRPFIIIGVMQKKPQMHTAETPDERLNWIPSSVYELLNNPKKIDAIAVAYKDYEVLSQTKKMIQKVVALNHGVDPSDISIINFSDLAEDQAKVNSFFVGMQIFLGIVGGLTLLIAGVGIVNVMYASVTRATRKIGIKMALGATTMHILLHYIFESLVATVIGGVIGMVITVIAIYLIRLIPMHGELFVHIGKPKPVLSFLVFVVVIIVLGIVGFIAGLFPALKAAKVDPAEALVYE